jgi:glyoxylase-like metal-dependent hydrolase (beta-lactamase superfamily II)
MPDALALPALTLPAPTLPALHLPALTVLERGWLSSNNVLLHGDEGGTLIDSGHARHAEQTVALVTRALDGRPLHRLVNTHLHSDHCGGNAALQAACAPRTEVPPGLADAARVWDDVALGYQPTGQCCPRFRVDGVVRPGDEITSGPWRLQALAAPGHDPHALLFFDAASGLLISGDALWQDGFGVVFPELDGEAGFDDVAATLDLIEHLPVRHVVPGHGGPFADVAGALLRARQRLAGLRRDPARHARHGAKVLIKYHLMELGEQPMAELQAWLAATPLLGSCQRRSGQSGDQLDFGQRLLDELLSTGALKLSEGVVKDAG